MSGPEPLEAELPDPDRALLRFALKLTAHPWTVEADDVDQLRRAGFEDRAIHDAVQVVAYFAYVNRIAQGLGVELEPYWEEDGNG